MQQYVKRGMIILITGIGVEAAVLWCFDRYTHLNLIQRINWRNLALWSCFSAGFATAMWLWLWGSFLNKIFSLRKKPVQKNSEPAVQVGQAGDRPQQSQPVPARMRVQNQAILSVEPTNDQGNSTSQNVVHPNLGAAVPAAPVSQKVKDLEALSNLEPDLDMMAFKHVSLEGKNIDLVYSSDTRAILCTILSEPHTWTVDTRAPIEESVWTDETGHTIQPCLILLKQAAALEKMEPDSTLIPTIVLMRGTIQNSVEALPYLQQHHITIATDQPATMPDVQTIRDLLISNFSLFPPSYEAMENTEGQTEPETEESTENNPVNLGDNNG